MTDDALHLWIEAEQWPAGEWHPDDAVTDVVVTLGDGSRWIATFCTFSHLDTLRQTCVESGENLGGRYLWASDLILVEDTARATVEAVVRDLVAAGDVPSAFSPMEQDHDGQTQNG